MKIEWIEGFKISVSNNNNVLIISANREGLLSLAKQLETLAESETGNHIHYDQYNSLEQGSIEMVISKE